MQKDKADSEIGHTAVMTSALTSRYDHLDDKAQYKAFCGSFKNRPYVIEHFECELDWRLCLNRYEIHGSSRD